MTKLYKMFHGTETSAPKKISIDIADIYEIKRYSFFSNCLIDIIKKIFKSRDNVRTISHCAFQISCE